MLSLPWRMGIPGEEDLERVVELGLAPLARRVLRVGIAAAMLTGSKSQSE
jgi:hypothetical protein